MASLKDLIVMGPARFLDKLYGNLEGNAATASRLGTSTVGASDRPIYLSGGTATTTTYRMAATNAISTSAHAITTDLPTGIWYVSGTSDILGQSDGVAIVNQYNSSWITEIYQDYRTGQIALRGKNNGTWQPWRTVLDNKNYATHLDSHYVTLETEQTINGLKIFTTNPQFKTTNYTSTPISLIDDGTNYGHTMLIGAGGTTYIGAGESASGLYSKLAVKSTEDLILGADSNIRFHTNADNATATSGITLNASNHFYPQTTSTGSIGTSGNKWKEAYFSDTVTAGKGFTVDGTMTFYPEKSNEINFGGTNNSTTIYIGYRATDSRPVPTKFIFGSSGGTASLQCNTVYLGSGTSSYVSSSQYTGNAATATKATQDASGNTITTSYLRRYDWWNSGNGNNVDTLRAGITFAYNNHNAPTTGTIVAFDCRGNESYSLQIMGAYQHTSNHLYFRNRNGDNNTWGSWRTVLDNSNYTDYTVTKTGTGASGTWGINITGSAGSVAWGNVSGKPSFNYLPLAGGTMNAGSQIIRAGQSKSWISGRDGALLRINTLSGYSPAISIKTNNGTWEIGAYDNASYTDKLIFSFATDANYSANNNSTTQWMITKDGYFNGSCASANSVAWGNVSGKPSTFAPSSHTHSYLPLSGGSVTGAISITTSGVTNSFYSQNSSYTHYSTNASVGHWFNKAVYVQGEIYAGSSYNKRVYHMGNIVYGSEPANPVDRMIWLYPA